MAVRVLCYKVNLFYNKLIALGDAKNTIGCWISESCDLNDQKLHCSLETEECRVVQGKKIVLLQSYSQLLL